MTRLIHDVKSDFQAFWVLPIFQDGEEYPKTGFDEINSTLLVERLAESGSHDDLALVLPDDPSVLPLIVVEALLALVQVDKLDSDSGFLETLKPGDHVALFDNHSRMSTPGTFEGMQEREGEKYFRISREIGRGNRIYELIPPNRRWRVKPYVGDDTGRRQQATKMLGEQIEELLAIDPGELMTYERSRALLVTGDKASVKEQLGAISLGDDSLLDVFPVGDYSDETSYRMLGSDRLGRRPSLGLVSHADLAANIALGDPSVKLIIIDGAAKVRGGIGSIDLLNNDATPRKIICLLNSWNDEELNMLSDRGIDSWVWSQKDFKKLDLTSLSDKQKRIEFRRHEHVMKRLAHGDTRLIPAELPPIASSLPTTAREQIKNLVRMSPNNEACGSLIIRARTLLLRMMQAPLPLNILEPKLAENTAGEYIPILEQIDQLKKGLSEQVGASLPPEASSICTELCGNLKSLYRSLESSNPKHQLIMNALKDGKTTDIVCATPEYAIALESTLDRSGAQVLSANQLLSAKSEKLLLTGWFNPKFTARTFLAPYLITEYLLYEEEMKPYAWMNKTHPAAPNSQVDQKLRKMYAPKLIKPEITGVVTTQPQRQADIETVSTEIETKFADHLDAQALASNGNHQPVDGIRIIFDDGSRTYAGKGTKLDRLDRSARDISHCIYDDLAPGDELVFAASSRSVFQDYIAGHVSKSDEYQALSATASIWRSALLDYASDYSLTASDLSAKLKTFGANRSPGNIKAWLEGETIGPEEDGMEAIKLMTLNRELSNNFKEVMEACARIRAIHTQAGRTLARHIVKAAAGTSDTSDSDYDEQAAEYARHSRIMLVRSIGEKTISVAPELLGRLITD